MPIQNITVAEKFNGRQGTSGKNASVDYSFIAKSTALETDLDVKKAVLLAAPGYVEDVDGSFLSRLGVSDFQELGGGGRSWGWEVRVTYSKNDIGPLNPGDSKFTFKTSGGTKKVNYSLGTTKYDQFNGAAAKDHKGAIGVTSSGIEGVDIVVPVYEFTETHVVPSASVNDAYKRTLFSLTGRLNDALFKGLDPSECLFMGAEGTKQGAQGDWDLTYNFAGSPNTWVKIQGIKWPVPAGVPKKGWQYIWVEFDDYDDPNGKGLAKKPIGAFVEDVYVSGTMSNLNIGIA